MSDHLPRVGGLPEPEKYERLVERLPDVWWADAGPFVGLHQLNAAPGGGLGVLTHNRTIAAFLQLVWAEEYVDHTMPEGFHDFTRFITPDELTEGLARNGMVVQEMQGVARAGDGSGRRVLTADLTITYVGWALRTR